MHRGGERCQTGLRGGHGETPSVLDRRSNGKELFEAGIASPLHSRHLEIRRRQRAATAVLRCAPRDE
jgi:hypothetical protein